LRPGYGALHVNQDLAGLAFCGWAMVLSVWTLTLLDWLFRDWAMVLSVWTLTLQGYHFSGRAMLGKKFPRS
jgi:hypothetical protein